MAAVLFVVSDTAHALPDLSYPEDPFAKEYRPPVPKEVGTAAGQVRIIGSAGLAYATGSELALQGTLEAMTFSVLGVRVSTAATATRRSSDPRVWSFLVGPSLHVLPYRRIDIALFVEGGVALVDPFADGSTQMPLVRSGVALQIFLSGIWFLQLETAVAWGVFDRGGAPAHYTGGSFLFGVGIAL
jgi:hypothetical protein